MPAVQEMFQSYLEELDSRDPQSQLKAVRCIKHNVIGSQAKKTQLTLLGAVPKLVDILANGETVAELVVEAITVLGSLAHGPPETVQAIISSNAVPVLLDEVLSGEENVVNASARTLCTLCVSRRVPCDIIYQNHRVVARLVEFLQSDSALLARSAAIIVAHTCSSSEHQVTLAAGNVLPALSALVHHSCRKDLFHAAIEALSAVVYRNKETSRLAVNVLNFVEVLSEVLSSGHGPEVKLSAAECLTNLYRADTVGERSDVIQLKVLPSLIKFCRKSMDIEVRIKAARVLAYLTEDSAHLEERTAESERIIATLVSNLEPQPPKDDVQRMVCNGSNEELQLQLSEASLEVLAALCTHCEDLRTTVLEAKKVLMKHVTSALQGEEFGMKVAALKCVLFWSRSPQLLRTTLIDYEVWRPLQELLSNRNETILILATAAMSNFLLPVSASRQLLVDADILPTLLLLLDHSSSTVQTNAAWALMNLSHRGTGEIPPQFLESSTIQRLIRVSSQDRCPEGLLLKTVATLSNILSTEAEVDQLFLSHHEVLKSLLVRLLNGSPSPSVVEQILILILNVGSGTHRSKIMILEWEEFMKLMVEHLRAPSTPDRLLAPLIGIVSTLADPAVPNCIMRQSRLEEFGVKYALQKREASASSEILSLIKTALTALSTEPSLL